MRNKTPRTDQKGFVLILVAAVLIVLIGFVALGVDAGTLYSARTSAQEVADAAALAGAYTFITNPTDPQLATFARDTAIQVAANNSVMGQPVTAGDLTVSVDLANKRVSVSLASVQSTYFAKAIGISTANIKVTGVAEAADQGTGSSCVKPWFVPNSVFGTGGICAACTATPPQVLIDTTTGLPTSYGMSKIGTQFTIKPQNPSGAIGPGEFYAIRLPGSTGASDYRDNIMTCSNSYLRCHDFYGVEPGNMVGPTKQGVDGLIGDPPRDTFDLDHFTATGNIRYVRQDGTFTDISDGVIVAPIWDTCGMSGFCPSGSLPGGAGTSVQIIGFGVFFLEGIQGNDVVARLINISACGTTSSTESGGTVLSFPLRLVRMP